VLSLSLNTSHRNILASGSADTTVKIWDLSSGKNIHTCSHHSARVNRVKWSPSDSSVIFSASEDKTIAILDSRYPNDKLTHRLNTNELTIESACWNVNQPTQICYTTDKGNLHIIDVRSVDKILASTAAHQGHSITDVKIGSKNMVYTCS
jgi:periodic tryptophan protein 1